MKYKNIIIILFKYFVRLLKELNISKIILEHKSLIYVWEP